MQSGARSAWPQCSVFLLPLTRSFILSTLHVFPIFSLLGLSLSILFVISLNIFISAVSNILWIIVSGLLSALHVASTLFRRQRSLPLDIPLLLLVQIFL
jgi:hypothetical protein